MEKLSIMAKKECQILLNTKIRKEEKDIIRVITRLIWTNWQTKRYDKFVRMQKKELTKEIPHQKICRLFICGELLRKKIYWYINMNILDLIEE